MYLTYIIAEYNEFLDKHALIFIIMLSPMITCFNMTIFERDDTTADDDFCYKRVQTPGMSPPRAGAWTYCLFTP